MKTAAYARCIIISNTGPSPRPRAANQRWPDALACQVGRETANPSAGAADTRHGIGESRLQLLSKFAPMAPQQMRAIE
jgi:hypothetical protein